MGQGRFSLHNLRKESLHKECQQLWVLGNFLTTRQVAPLVCSLISRTSSSCFNFNDSIVAVVNKSGTVPISVLPPSQINKNCGGTNIFSGLKIIDYKLYRLIARV